MTVVTEMIECFTQPLPVQTVGLKDKDSSHGHYFDECCSSGWRVRPGNGCSRPIRFASRLLKIQGDLRNAGLTRTLGLGALGIANKVGDLDGSLDTLPVSVSDIDPIRHY